MSLAPRSERRQRVRRMSDVRPPRVGAARPGLPSASRAQALRRTRVWAALGTVALASLPLVAVALYDLQAGSVPAPDTQYLLAGLLGIALLALALPVAMRLARVVALQPHRSNRRLVAAIGRSIARGEFRLVYAPQVDLETGKPLNVEAVIRWRRRGGDLAPSEFLPDVERSDAIAALTEHVLELAVAQAASWRDEGNELHLAVNLSAANLRDFSVVRHSQRLLSAHDVAASSITLEVTETAVLDEPEQARAVLDALAELGFRISVDDFGTGYSSLLWLRLFPVDEVKIDRTFVSQMHDEGEAFVSGVIRLGHDLGLSVLAEGVEDEQTLRRLQEIGCDAAQGYLFSHPLEAEAVPAWVASAHEATRWAPQRKEMALAAGAPDLAQARELIHETARELGFDEGAIWDMKLAATEALMNAIEHGTPTEDGMVHLRLAREHGDMLLEVWGGSDAPPSPASEGPTHGRGIAIMAALMDEVELRRNALHSRIRLAKHRRGREHAPS